MKYTEVYNLLYKTAQEAIESDMDPVAAAILKGLAGTGAKVVADSGAEIPGLTAPVPRFLASNETYNQSFGTPGRVKSFNGIVNGKRVFAANNNDNMPLEPQINAAANGQGRNIPIRKSK